MVKVEALVLTVQDMMRLAMWFLEDNLSNNRETGRQIIGTLIVNKNRGKKRTVTDHIEIPLPTGAKIFKVRRHDKEMIHEGSYFISGYSKVPEKNGIVPLCEDVASYRGFGTVVRIPRGF